MNRGKKTKKKNPPTVTLVEGTRRQMLGIPSDEDNATTWKDTLVLIIVLIMAFFMCFLLKK